MWIKQQPGWMFRPGISVTPPEFILASSILHRYTRTMADAPKLSHTSAMILQAVATGHLYGYTVMEVTGLPSGTVYPAMRRLERDQLIRSQWERQSVADAEQRPPRKYYKLTRAGEKTLEASRKRYPLLAKLVATEEVEDE
jgi:PadR family transcriptional regulator PadR